MSALVEDVCPECNGEGVVAEMDPFGHETLWECPDCAGRGTVLQEPPC